MNRYFRWLLIVIAIAQLLIGLGFALGIPAVTRLWPFSYTGTLAYTVIGSIIVAAGASALWCLWTRAYGAVAGIALDYLCIAVPMFIFTLQVARGSSALIAFALSLAAIGVVGLFMYLYTRRFPLPAQPRLPRPVHIAFAVFVVVLVLIGGALILRTPNILPWNVTSTVSVLYGWLYIGAAAYFAYALIRPGWYNAGGQLAGFLAYDLVLIVPFVQRLPTVEPRYAASLIVYTIIVAGSGLLAAYYLFINAETRLTRTRLPDAL